MLTLEFIIQIKGKEGWIDREKKESQDTFLTQHAIQWFEEYTKDLNLQSYRLIF